MITDIINDSVGGHSPVSPEEIRIERMRPADIDLNLALQTRVNQNQEVIDHYCELMKKGTQFPACQGVRDAAGLLHIYDGIHRIAAAIKAEVGEIEIEVRPGERDDGLKRALGANATHGLQRTNADKRHAVEMALTAFSDLSDRVIADMCGVGNQLVGAVRKEMEEAGQLCDSHNSIRKGRDNKSYPPKRSTQPSAQKTASDEAVPAAASVSADTYACDPADAATVTTIVVSPMDTSDPSAKESKIENSIPGATHHEESAVKSDQELLSLAVHDSKILPPSEPASDAPLRFARVVNGKEKFDFLAADIRGDTDVHESLQRLKGLSESSSCIAVRFHAENLKKVLNAGVGTYYAVIGLLDHPVSSGVTDCRMDLVVILVRGQVDEPLKFDARAFVQGDAHWSVKARELCLHALGERAGGKPGYVTLEELSKLRKNSRTM